MTAIQLTLAACAVGGGGTDDRAGAATVPLQEGFETGTKADYAAATVRLASGDWSLDDAVIGTLDSDVKTGRRSGRLRNGGHITMRFDHMTGAGIVTIRHASFGSDPSGTWALFSSQDQGITWQQVGSSQVTSGGSFSTARFVVDVDSVIRFEIRKLDGGANQINIDDITITDFGSASGGAALSRHTSLGIPAATSEGDPDNYLSAKSGYVLSYDTSRKVPNWVSWELNTSYLGSVSRQNDYRPDDTLPPTMPQAALADYANTGFDRGHMCPSGDRTLTVPDNEQTFYLTNMVPQAPHANRGPWEFLEAECRRLAESGNELFVISGGVYSASSHAIGSGVVVPDKTFKVIVVLDANNEGASSVTENTRVIGVLLPNDDSQISQSADWRSFRVSVDDIEAATGDDFLSDVDPAVQAVIEARVDQL